MIAKREKNTSSYLARFWPEERKMTALLVALIFDTLIVYPLVNAISSSVGTHIINVLVILAVYLLGLFVLTHHIVTRLVFGVISIAVIFVHIVRLVFGANWLLGLDIFLSLLIAVAYSIFIFGFVYKEGPVTRQRLEGAVAAYLFITITFALSYNLISIAIPGALEFSRDLPDIYNPRFIYAFNYFSISTITTLGFGDIIPVHPIARTLTMIEALVGQLYPAILLARLVSLSILDSRRSDRKETITR